MKQLRILGFALLAVGGVMLLLLLTPWRDWASDHSIIHLVSRTNRRVGDEVHGKVDLLISIVGDVVVMFAGLWFAFLVPRMMDKYAQMAVPAAPVSSVAPDRTLPPPPPPSGY